MINRTTRRESAGTVYILWPEGHFLAVLAGQIGVFSAAPIYLAFLFQYCSILPAMNPESEPTALPFVVFSDLIVREEGTGKVSLIGTFEFFNAPSFPFQSPSFFATIAITNVHLSSTQGKPAPQINVNLRIEDPKSGHIFGNATSTVGVREGKTLHREDVIVVPLPIPPMNFQAPGSFKVIVSVDNEKVGERFLRISPATAATVQ